MENQIDQTGENSSSASVRVRSDAAIATYRNVKIAVTYVSACLSWALITYDIQNQTRKFKVDSDQLEGISRHELYELQYKQKIKKGT